MISQTHRLDVVPGGVTAVVHVKQYQTGESLVFELFSRFGDFEISAEYTECTVRGTKSDGNGYSADATCDPSNNSVTVELTEQMTAVAGRQPYEITITESAGRMITTTFILDVHRAALDADTVESESVIKEVQTIVKDYLEDHPGLFVVDPTLTQSNQAADAKVTGDHVGLAESILLGESVTGLSHFPMQYFERGDVAVTTRTHRVYNPTIIDALRDITLTADSGFRFYLYFYDANGTQTGTSGWQTSYHMPSGKFRVVIARTSESIGEIADVAVFLSAITIDGLVKDISLKEQAVLNYAISADWKVGGYNTMASVNGTTSASPRRRRTEIFFDSPKTIIVTAPDNIQFVAGFYDKDDATITYRNSFESTPIYACNVCRMRIAFKDAEDTTENPINLAVGSEYTCGIVIAEEALTAQTERKKLKVMTYNIGRFSYGVSPYYLSEDFDEKVANYKKFFSEQKADIIGIQEFNTTLDINDGTGSQKSNDLIFDYLYPYRVDRNAGPSIKSKYDLFSTSIGQFSTGRYYAEADMVINGKVVHLVDVHFTPNTGGESARQTEATELLPILQKHTRVVCFGDFNSLNLSLFDIFTNAGYKLCNGGYLPIEWTYTHDPADYETGQASENVRYIDNILVSPNITVSDSYRVNAYSELASDHIPFVAELLI